MEERTVKAEISLNAQQVAEILKLIKPVDRLTAMVEKYGEACDRKTAAKIVSCSQPTMTRMLQDGRVKAACGGRMVDVRSLAAYIERRTDADHEMRMCKKRERFYAV